ncbi:response regulator [Parvibaculum sp.]|jgi:CheY-like chemotaxis protein|uniref:response regulator n=1 Tax=Parvibaculum sp. TaxID=2024848 RepID=UPI000C4A5688|nr:response regulator [Parvibaculum sp.]HAC56717.1 response regulator [Rhodobiaceae bacterium]MAU61486.1 response regulator [Parvibaculum sp.]MBO6668240.1 response regulator [Parvibaculum sp.]MBO6690984.1 response regulator [Parvibaculum sp.]MBO6714642.1 response regulator [Parvibaculum sp.]|tara:strand:- start:27194 stop:27988 length:795 start_codon:yes stop_codon:yes gene_type:complete
MSLADQIAPLLPHLRRYARALTGNQKRGDAYVRSLLEAIVADDSIIDRGLEPRVGLYKAFYGIWSTADLDVAKPEEAAGAENIVSQRLSRMTPINRQALLLTAMEGFSNKETAQILQVDDAEISPLIDAALKEIDNQIATNVLIIEDEPIISMDLEQIVRDLGHDVMATVVTRDEAVNAIATRKPGLVLADIQLADGSSGIDAVKDIFARFSVPVIFITAYPERLLTGERPEPTFLITKPFLQSTVKAAIGQALFFNAEKSEAA